MKHLLLTTIAAVVLVGCGESSPEISIHEAAFKGNIKVIKKSLASEDNLESRDIFNLTPLHHAALGGQNEIISLLIDKGADVNAMTVIGATPLDCAIQEKKTETADLLHKRDGKSGAGFSINIAASLGNIEAVEKHLATGANVNSKNDGFFLATPLHRAVYAGHKEVTEVLIANRANVNAMNEEEGETPLHLAARGGHKEIAELLIAGDADVNAIDNYGETPLDRAKRFTIAKEIADLLRKHGGKTGEELKAEGK